MLKKSVYYNANAFFTSHKFYGWREIRDKSFSKLEIGIYNFWLENHRLEFFKAYPKYKARLQQLKSYCYYCFALLIFEVDSVRIGLPPLLWYFLYISCWGIVLILSIYIYLQRFDYTFLEEKYPIKTNLLGFKFANFSLYLSRVFNNIARRLFQNYLLTFCCSNRIIFLWYF